MSVLRKKPFIESRIENLTSSQKNDLLSLLNSKTDAEVGLSLSNPDNSLRDYLKDKASVIKAVILELSPLKTDKIGFLIYDGANCTFIAYFNNQNVDLYDINITNQTHKKVDEECTIEELRRCLIEIPTPETPTIPTYYIHDVVLNVTVLGEGTQYDLYGQLINTSSTTLTGVAQADYDIFKRVIQLGWSGSNISYKIGFVMAVSGAEFAIIYADGTSATLSLTNGTLTVADTVRPMSV